MKIKYLTKILIFICFYLCIFSNVFGKINSSIIVKVGNEIITNSDLENEVQTILFLSNQKLNQENIDKVKNLAVQTLIKNLIKKSEIKKYKITQYSENELDAYLLNICNKLNTDILGLKKIFASKNLNYDFFIEKNKTELIWKTLIYYTYKNQIDINTIEVENEVKNRVKNKIDRIEYKLSEIELSSNNQNIKKVLKDVYRVIKSDGFEEAAKKFSISSSASKGGDIGLFPEKTLSGIYLNELKKIKSGEITNPIKNADSITILKIESINVVKEKNLDLNKIKEKIITKKKEEKLSLFSRSHFSNIESKTLIKFK